MKKSKLLKRTLSFVFAFLFSVSVAFSGVFKANAFDLDYISKDGMALGYSIVNGYSKMSIKKNQYADNKIGVYCGLDVSNFYVLASLGWFYITNGVDIDRAMYDTDYALEKIEALDSHLSGAGITNERAKRYKSEILKGASKVYYAFDTVGLYVFDATDERALELMDSDFVDCVLDGGQAPKNMRDLNMDGKSDKADARLMQKYLAGSLSFDDSDEKQYALFACDVNGDKITDILDVTALMKGEV